MLNEIAIAACLAMSPNQCATCGPGGGGMEFSPGSSSGSWTAGAGPGNPYDAVASGGGGGGDQLYPFDSPEPWLHGWFQEIPAYGGYHTFRPHNYKHVIAQMEVAGRWGMNPTMPYSAQWYTPFRQRAGMHPDFGHQQASNEFHHPGMLAAANPGGSNTPAQPANIVATHPATDVQTVGAFHRGYPGTAIPGIATPYYQVPAVPQSYAPQQEYLDRLEQLQKQLEQQTFQMQVMQEQLRNQPQNLQPWQQPNYAQFGEQPAQGYVPQGNMVPNGYGVPQGYQELPLPPTSGPALQPAYQNPGFGGNNPGLANPNLANPGITNPGMMGFGPSYSAPTNGINLLANPNLPAGSVMGFPGGMPSGIPAYQPSMSMPQPGAGWNPNMQPTLPTMPGPQSGIYRGPENAGYNQAGYPANNAVHANYNFQAPQPHTVAPNMNWSGSNYGPGPNYAPSAGQPQSNGSNSGAQQQPSNGTGNFGSGFRPFGRLLR